MTTKNCQPSTEWAFVLKDCGATADILTFFAKYPFGGFISSYQSTALD